MGTEFSSLKQIEIQVDPKKLQTEIPLEPVFYSFLMNTIVNKKQKKCIRTAVSIYQKTCRKAARQLIRDLEKCRKKYK
jgi:hypothetical protein